MLRSEKEISYSLAIQCAAVRTQSSSIKAPPQAPPKISLNTSTCQGICVMEVTFSPPTICGLTPSIGELAPDVKKIELKFSILIHFEAHGMEDGNGSYKIIFFIIIFIALHKRTKLHQRAYKIEKISRKTLISKFQKVPKV
jgi:hypothetical protein